MILKIYDVWNDGMNVLNGIEAPRRISDKSAMVPVEPKSCEYEIEPYTFAGLMIPAESSGSFGGLLNRDPGIAFINGSNGQNERKLKNSNK